MKVDVVPTEGRRVIKWIALGLVLPHRLDIVRHVRGSSGHDLGRELVLDGGRAANMHARAAARNATTQDVDISVVVVAVFAVCPPLKVCKDRDGREEEERPPRAHLPNETTTTQQTMEMDGNCTGHPGRWMRCPCNIAVGDLQLPIIYPLRKSGGLVVRPLPVQFDSTVKTRSGWTWRR